MAEYENRINSLLGQETRKQNKIRCSYMDYTHVRNKMQEGNIDEDITTSKKLNNELRGITDVTKEEWLGRQPK